VNAVVRSSVPPVPPVDPEVQLLIPEQDVADPEFSIVIPSLNEELTMADFVTWCLEGLEKAGVRGEILIIDSGKDRAAEIALAHGARVLKTPKRGLGRAYIDARPFVRGKFIVMGDADCTYDFREIRPFYDAYAAGAEFVMGSRFKGKIDDNAMPALHRYFGTPVTTFILNFIFGSRFSDIHCGMRGISTDALARMKLSSQGWEYASEMVLKSVHMKLATAEVPIHFHKDPEGRLSHMKRRGWLEPWRAGWMNLRAMFVYGFDFFLLWPGLLLSALGLALMLPLLFGPVSLGGISFSSNAMLFGLASTTLGVSMLFSAFMANILFDYSGQVQPRFERLLPYNTTIIAALAAIAAGIALIWPLFSVYRQNDYTLPAIGIETNWAIFGLWLVISAFQTFIFALMVRALGVVLPKKQAAAQPAGGKA